MLQREELELLRWRISFIGYVIVAALLVLAFGFWNTQIVQVGYYQERAEDNRVREVPLVAPRGRIYDREHRIIADRGPQLKECRLHHQQFAHRLASSLIVW